MKPSQASVVGIACSIFRNEIELLVKERRVDISFTYLDSMLHMNPSELDRRLQAIISEERQKNRAIVLVYGDCSAHMIDFESDNYVGRVHGTNCCEIILGKEQYQQLRSEGAFFVMPEWAIRWREVFQDQLGLKGDNARCFMTDMHKKLVYLDTGLSPFVESFLDDISQYSGLPWEVLPVSLDHLPASINDAKERIEGR